MHSMHGASCIRFSSCVSSNMEDLLISLLYLHFVIQDPVAPDQLFLKPSGYVCQNRWPGNMSGREAFRPGHMSVRETCLVGTHVLPGHMSVRETCLAGTHVWLGHMPCRDTCLSGTHVCLGHMPVRGTCLCGRHVWPGHMSGRDTCPGTHVWPGRMSGRDTCLAGTHLYQWLWISYF